MRNLKEDLEKVETIQNRWDLSDEYLKEHNCSTRNNVDLMGEYSYGITFIESDIAREWLERAIFAEEKLNTK